MHKWNQWLFEAVTADKQTFNSFITNFERRIESYKRSVRLMVWFNFILTHIYLDILLEKYYTVTEADILEKEHTE